MAVASPSSQEVAELILARKYLETYYPGREFIHLAAVAEHLPLNENTFGILIGRDIIEHVTDHERHLQEVYRGLERAAFSQTPPVASRGSVNAVLAQTLPYEVIAWKGAA